MAAPPPAAGGAKVSQTAGPTLEETRTQLSQLSIKISKCEIALESHGSYLGITDPVRESAKQTDRQTDRQGSNPWRGKRAHSTNNPVVASNTYEKLFSKAFISRIKRIILISR